MTLPTRNDKDYLEITDRGKVFAIVAGKRHADELEALFNGRGLACRRDTGVGEDVLRFDDSVNRAAVETVLESYKQAKGS